MTLYSNKLVIARMRARRDSSGPADSPGLLSRVHELDRLRTQPDTIVQKSTVIARAT